MADYEIKKGMLGHKVLYNCPACGSPLTSSLDKAGTNDACPDCNRPHVIPGSTEKTQFEQATATKQRQKLEEEKRRAAVHAAAKNTPKPVFTPSPNPAPQNGLKTVGPIKPVDRRRTKFGDGILDVAFTVTRLFAVVVIIIGVVALLLIAAQYGSTYSDYQKSISTQVEVPRDSDYNDYVRRISEASSNSGDGAPNPDDPDRTLSANPLIALLKKYKLLGDRDLLDEILSVSKKLRSVDPDADFIPILDKFLTNKKDKRIAARWFCLEYEIKCDAREREIAKVNLHNQMRESRMWSLTTAAGGVFGGLISFMILPLLIRIETNTRYGEARLPSSP